MASNFHSSDNELTSHLISDVKKLLWGPDLKEDVFLRWAQGFDFSEDEPTALVQHEGGPCAIITPVQAYLLKNALFNGETNENWRQASSEQVQIYLLNALCQILELVNSDTDYILVFNSSNQCNDEIENSMEGHSSEGEESNLIKRIKAPQEHFHKSLRLIKIGTLEDVYSTFKERIDSLQSPYGVLLFLYSVLLTKGIDQIKNEVEDPSEALIDSLYGHGNQSLINLLLTGKAVSNVWDNDKDIGGLKLQGVSKQSVIGFLTQLEHLRLCEVGWFLKRPQFPVWLLGSETHLTVLFSQEIALVSPETKEEMARRVFKSFDPEGNGFILVDVFEDVLRGLDLYCDPQYVYAMQKKLDSEGLRVILLSNFMNEFFPNQEKSKVPETFTLYHYNGLRRSCPDGKVVYQEGQAILLESDVRGVSESNNILTCLMTKWPGIEVQWLNGITPSLN